MTETTKIPYIYVPPRRNKTRTSVRIRRSMLTGRWYRDLRSVKQADSAFLNIRNKPEYKEVVVANLEIGRANGQLPGARMAQAEGLRKAFKEHPHLKLAISKVGKITQGNPNFNMADFIREVPGKKGKRIILRRNGIPVARLVEKERESIVMSGVVNASY